MKSTNLPHAEDPSIPSQKEFDELLGLSAIQECGAELQAFLRMTRSRMQSIANDVPESDVLVRDDPHLTRLFRGSDGAESLRPLPILAPPTGWFSAVEVASDEMDAEVTERAMAGEQVTVSFQPFSPLLSLKDRKDMDWRLVNGFDRNNYFGPVDFMTVEQKRTVRVATASPLATANHSWDSSPSNAPPNQSHSFTKDPIKRFLSLNLHLANQIRKN